MFCFVRSIKLCKLRITAASQTQKITATHWSCNHHLGQKQHRLWENFTFEDRVLCEEINLPMPKLVLNIKNFNSKHSIAKIITLAVTTILHISLPFALQYFSQRHSVGSIPQKQIRQFILTTPTQLAHKEINTRELSTRFWL